MVMVDCDFATMGTYIFPACGDIHRMPNMLYSRTYQIKQKMEKRRVYISGKISGLDYYYVQLKFSACAESLKSIGYEPVNPLKRVATVSIVEGTHACRYSLVENVRVHLSTK